MGGDKGLEYKLILDTSDANKKRKKFTSSSEKSGASIKQSFKKGASGVLAISGAFLVANKALDTFTNKQAKNPPAKPFKVGSQFASQFKGKLGEVIGEVKKFVGQNKLLEKSQNAFVKIKDKASSIIPRVKLLAKGFKLVAIAVAGITAGVLLASKAIDSFISSHLVRLRAKVFGTNKELAQSFNDALGGQLTKRESLKEVTDLAKVGLSDKQIINAGKLVGAMEVLGGVSRDTALEVLKTGEASSSLLQGFKLSTTAYNDSLLALEVATGRVPDQLDKSRLLLRLLSKQLKEMPKDVRDAFTTNPFQALKSTLTDIKDQLTHKVGEALVEHKDLIISASKEWAKWGEEVVRWGFFVVDKLKPVAKILQEIRKTGLGGIAATPKGFGSNLSFAMGGTDKQDSDLIAQLKAHSVFIKKIEKAEKDAQRKRNRGLSKGARQELEELKAFQDRAREQTRNFLQFAFNNISAMGGTLSGVFSAMKDSFEQSRIFSSLKSVRDVVSKTRDLSFEQIQAMQKTGELSANQAKSAILFNTIQKAGLSDLRELKDKLKSVTTELKAQVSGSEKLAILGAIEKQETDLKVDAIREQKKLVIALNAIQTKSNDLQAKIARTRSKETKERLLFELKNLPQISKTLVKTNKFYNVQKDLQSELLKLSKQSVKFNFDVLAPMQKINENKKKSLQLAGEELAKKRELLALGLGPVDSKSKVIDSLNAEKSLALDISGLKIQQIKLDNLALFARKAGDKDKADLWVQESLRLQSEIDSKNRSLGVQGRITEATKKQTTANFQLKKSFVDAMEGGIEASQKIANAFGSAFSSIESTVVSAFSNMGEAIFAFSTSLDNVDLGAKMGAGFLDLLSGIALQFSAVFAKIGALYLFAGNPMGAAVLAGALGLGVLGGALKGASSLVSAPTISSGATGGASTPTPSVSRAPIERTQTVTENYYIVNTLPGQTEAEVARSWAKFGKRNKRIMEGIG